MRIDIGPTVGPFVVIDTKPPYKPWDGNQATYLFFPVFASFILTIIGTLSAPLIAGLSTVNVHAASGEGVVKLGGWGMCIEGFPNQVSNCISYSIWANNTQALAALPTGVLSMGISPSAVNDSFKIASGIMHVLECVVSLIAVMWALAASGEYERKGKDAFSWTRWAWGANTACLFAGLVPFALDLALIPRTAAMAKLADGTPAKVTAGATIYMSAAATFLNLGTLLVRLFWARRQPRPSWSQGDFHTNPLPPAPDSNKDLPAVPAFGDEAPPTWESLNIESTQRADGNKDGDWTRADGALESIDEKRASLASNGYAV